MRDAASGRRDIAYPWELPIGSMPSQLIEILRHARNFFRADRRASTRLQLASGACGPSRVELGHDELVSNERDRIEEWTEQVAERLDDVRSWVADLPAFWALLNDFGVNLGVQEFVNAMVGRIAADPEGFAEDSAVHRSIRDRELRLKSKRARLAHRSALENWNGLGVGGQFDFRWGITQSYMKDIATALAAHL